MIDSKIQGSGKKDSDAFLEVCCPCLVRGYIGNVLTMEDDAKGRAASVHPGAAAVFESMSPLPLPILQDSHHCRGAICD